MKFINKKTCLLSVLLLSITLSAGCSPKEQEIVKEYETTQYDRTLYECEPFASQLCVANENISSEQLPSDSNFHAAGLFALNQKQVICSEEIHERLFPASTTKMLTFYLAVKYGTLTDKITVSKNAASVPSDSSVAGLREGDVLTLEDLLYGLMLPSGNDSAVAIAEYISGTESEFVQLMNEEANALGASNSHFVNPHGYHDENHYTTAYDLYLILSKCMTNQTFLNVVSSPSYTVTLKNVDGSERTRTWKQTNLFVNGTRTAPDSVTVIGGKTGTTDEAGACLALLSRDSKEHPYISIVMGAESKMLLYDTMSSLLSLIPSL